MSEQTKTIEPTINKPAQSKSEIVQRLLSRKSGATAEEIGVETFWQPHSVRAYLTGLRKKGMTIAREERRDGTKAYRLLKSAAATSEQ